LRRRWTVAVAVVLIVISAFSASSLVAASIALFAVAVHRRVGVMVPVALLNVAAGAAYFWLRPPQQQPYWVSLVLTVAVTAALAAWGMFVRARRQLVWSLRERSGPRPSSGCSPSRPGTPSGPGSPGRCMTWSPTGCR